MAAGTSERLWSVKDVVALIESETTSLAGSGCRRGELFADWARATVFLTLSDARTRSYTDIAMTRAGQLVEGAAVAFWQD